MITDKVVADAAQVVKKLAGQMYEGHIGVQDAEQEMVQLVNWLGDLVQELIERLQEPTQANRISVDGEVAEFDQVRNLRSSTASGSRWCAPGAATGGAIVAAGSRRWM